MKCEKQEKHGLQQGICIYNTLEILRFFLVKMEKSEQQDCQARTGLKDVHHQSSRRIETAYDPVTGNDQRNSGYFSGRGLFAFFFKFFIKNTKYTIHNTTANPIPAGYAIFAGSRNPSFAIRI